MQPNTSVTSNWLMLPAMVNDIALMRLPSSIYKMRPPYSPIRLGVSMVTLQPDKTDLKARHNENCCTCCTNTCHFLASIPQFTSINSRTSQNFPCAQPVLICAQRNARSGCWRNWWYRLQLSTTKITGAKK